MEPGGKEHKLGHLDGLRGLAALVVVFHHMACAFAPAAVFGTSVAAHSAAEGAIYMTPLQLLVAGNFAVCIFFVLSGYVLSYKFFVTKDAKYARSGAAKRYFRLMPPILASILLSYAVYRLGFASHLQAAQISGSDIWLAKLWPAGGSSIIEALQQGFYGVLLGRSDTTIFNNVLWTMEMEFFGSFLVFGFVALFGVMRRRWVAYLALAALFWNTYYLAFLIGLAMSDLTVNRPELKFSRLTLITALLVGLVLGAAPIFTETPTMYSNLITSAMTPMQLFVLLHVLGAGLVMLAVVYSRRLKSGLSIRPLRYLGQISFSLYLVHVLILGTFTCAMFVLLAPHMGYGAAVLISVLASVPLIWAVSHLFTHYIDTPAVKLSSRINSKLSD